MDIEYREEGKNRCVACCRYVIICLSSDGISSDVSGGLFTYETGGCIEQKGVLRDGITKSAFSECVFFKNVCYLALEELTRPLKGKSRLKMGIFHWPRTI
jgi:hypothetical protein